MIIIVFTQVQHVEWAIYRVIWLAMKTHERSPFTEVLTHLSNTRHGIATAHYHDEQVVKQRSVEERRLDNKIH